MLFNSLSFAFFLTVVYLLYWLVTNKNLRSQNILLLLSSYFFYGCWDWRFLFLLIFSTGLDYFTGLRIFVSNKPTKRFLWLWLSILVNVGFLGFFKYYNFFISSFSKALYDLGFHVNPWTLNLILPVGISFYTFHGLSYVIDIYRQKIKPEKNFINYSLFVSFFPLLLAGPIERATHLLPQIQNKRAFNWKQSTEGLRQILWGIFKKIAIADHCSGFVSAIFDNHSHFAGSTNLVGAILFTFQIYCDFSGYSDIAIGVAKLFGIDLYTNFAYPYFSRDIAEFWRRWHISLTSWFRDYIYIPLGGSRVKSMVKIRNILIIFLISSFWHGANWTFIFWGLLNALFILPSMLSTTHRKHLNIVAEGKQLPNLTEFFSMALTFSLTTLAWIFFRSPSLSYAFQFFSRLFSRTLFSPPSLIPGVPFMILLVSFFTIEWFSRKKPYALANLELKLPKWGRWATYYFLVVIIFLYASTEQQFIYFQF